jgi:hypothetical protein
MMNEWIIEQVDDYWINKLVWWIKELLMNYEW